MTRLVKAAFGGKFAVTHAANGSKKTLCGTTHPRGQGGWITSLRSATDEEMARDVTCSKCRRKLGLETFGNYRARMSRGLDCTACGANRGR